LAKGVPENEQQKLMPLVLDHMLYLKEVAKNINIFYKLKAEFVLYMINKFGIKSFVIFRMFKNII
jgi:hypothetical protein